MRIVMEKEGYFFLMRLAYIRIFALVGVGGAPDGTREKTENFTYSVLTIRFW